MNKKDLKEYYEDIISKKDEDIELLKNHIKSIENCKPINDDYVYKSTNKIYKSTNKIKVLKRIMFNLIIINIILLIIYAFNH